jgi:hypothetical protein
VVTFASMFACSNNHDNEQGYFLSPTPSPATIPKVTPSHETLQPFTGSKEEYTFRFAPYSREWQWEYDIVHFANLFLDNHPLLSMDGNSRVIEYGNYLGYFNPQFIELYEALVNTELRDDFIYAVEELIVKIPQSYDYQIIYGMHEIIAMIGDAHSRFGTRDLRTHARIGFYKSERFPVQFAYFADGVYCSSGNRLTHINNIPIADIMEILSQLVPSENVYRDGVLVSRDLLNSLDALRHIGVLNSNESVTYTFVVSNGVELIMNVNAISFDEFDKMEFDTGIFDFRNNDNYYSFEYFYEYNMFYVRYGRFSVIPPRYFTENVINELISIGNMRSLVIDLRDNSGGDNNLINDFLSFVCDNRAIFDDIFVVINRYTFSGGVIAAAIIKTQIEGVTLIGEPAGQPPNFFASDPAIGRVHSHDLEYVCSRLLHRTWPNYQYDALRPDIHVPHYFSDILSNHDAVLYYIKSKQ